MPSFLKIGIAGYGIVGRRRREFIDKHPRLKTVAVCDQKFKGSELVEDGIRFHDNYESLLEEDLDVLFVCMSNDMAAKVTSAGLEQGFHVFCEKPPARNLEEFAEVVRTHRKYPQLKLKYGFNHRYHDSVRDALSIIRSQELGRVVSMRGVYGKSKVVDFHTDWRCQRPLSGGGILLDQGIHMVDLIRLFAGDFVEIHSIVSNSFWNYDVEDNAYALMKSTDGVVCMLHSSATQWRHRFHLEITLSKGMIILSGILSSTKSYGAETMTIAYANSNDGGDPREQTTRYNQDNSWGDEINEFADAILTDKPITSGSVDEAWKTFELVYRIYCADPEWKDKFKLNDKVVL